MPNIDGDETLLTHFSLYLLP